MWRKLLKLMIKFYNAKYERQILCGKIILEEQLEWHRIC